MSQLPAKLSPRDKADFKKQCTACSIHTYKSDKRQSFLKSTLEAHTDCLLTKLEGSAGAHIRIEPTCIIITLVLKMFLNTECCLVEPSERGAEGRSPLQILTDSVTLHISMEGADCTPLQISKPSFAPAQFFQRPSKFVSAQTEKLIGYTIYVNILSSVKFLRQLKKKNQKQKKIPTYQSEKVFFKSVSDSVFRLRQFMF